MRIRIRNPSQNVLNIVFWHLWIRILSASLRLRPNYQPIKRQESLKVNLWQHISICQIHIGGSSPAPLSEIRGSRSANGMQLMSTSVHL